MKRKSFQFRARAGLCTIKGDFTMKHHMHFASTAVLASTAAAIASPLPDIDQSDQTIDKSILTNDIAGALPELGHFATHDLDGTTDDDLARFVDDDLSAILGHPSDGGFVEVHGMLGEQDTHDLMSAHSRSAFGYNSIAAPKGHADVSQIDATADHVDTAPYGGTNIGFTARL